MMNGDYSQAQIVNEGGMACGRCLIWLTAFVLFERVAWPSRARVAALAGGVAAALAVLCVGPGVGLPSVAVPLWAAVALGLNALPQPANAALNRFAVARIVPAFAAVVVALLFFLNVFNPVTSCADQVRTALAHGREYDAAVAGRDPRFFDYKGNRVSKVLLDEILTPLQDAAKADPDNSRVPILLAEWTEALWVINARDAQLAKIAVHDAQQAEAIDPLGRDGYLAEYQLRMEFARRLEAADALPGWAIGPAYRIFLKEGRWPNPHGREAIEQAKTEYQDAARAKAEDVNPFEPAVQYLEAAKVLERYLPYDPDDVSLRYRLAETLFKAWEDRRCREQALAALALDAAAPRPVLTEEQRRKLKVWSGD
jgi:hypothetical protein